jgi:hypothetical protein
VVERMNRTIMERVRCMLSHAKLPRSYWGEVALTAYYLINRSPSARLEGKSPEEVWMQRPINYFHLRVFGCKAMVHVPKEQGASWMAKLDPISL